MGLIHDIRSSSALDCIYKRSLQVLSRISDRLAGSHVGYKRAIIGLIPDRGRYLGLIPDLRGLPESRTKYRWASLHWMQDAIIGFLPDKEGNPRP